MKRKRVLQRIMAILLTLGIIVGDFYTPVYAAGDGTDDTQPVVANESFSDLQDDEEEDAAPVTEETDGDEEDEVVEEEPDAAGESWVKFAEVTLDGESGTCPEDDYTNGSSVGMVAAPYAVVYVWTDKDLSKPVIKTDGPNKTYNICPEMQEMIIHPQNYRFKLTIYAGGGFSGYSKDLGQKLLTGYLYCYRYISSADRVYYRYFSNLGTSYGKLTQLAPYVTEVEVDGDGPVPFTSMSARFQGFTSMTTFYTSTGFPYLSENCFSGCENLTTASVGAGLSSVPAGAFNGCSKLTSAKTGTTEMKTLSSFGANAFNGCKTYISGAFDARGKSVGASAFANCNLTSVTVGDNIDWANYSGNPISTVTIESSTSISNTFSGIASTLKTINAPSATTVASSFSGNNVLSTFNAPKLSTVCANAFKGCTGITSIPLEGLTSIGDSAFYGCTGIKTAATMANLTGIGSNAFYGSGITSVTADKLTGISAGAFQNCASLASASVRGATSIGTGAFSGCGSLTALYADNITSYGDSAFDNCTKLAVVNTEKATTIGSRAFYGLSSLSSVSLKNVTSIGANAFYGTGITTLDIPTGKKISIGSGAFAGGKLTTVKYDDYEENFNTNVTLGGSRADVFGTATFQFKPKPNPDPCAAPKANPASGSKVEVGDAISLECATDGAKIYYTTDGSAPTKSSSLYTAGISVPEDKAGKTFTIKAFAVKDGYKDSSVATFSYTVKKKSGENPTPGDPTPAEPTPEPNEPNLVEHTVTFKYANSTVHTEKVVEGGTVTFIPEVTRDNCTFIGWYAGNNLVWNPSSPVYMDINVAAKFINNTTGEIEPKDPGNPDPADPGRPDEGDEPYDDLDDPNLKENRDVYLVKGQKIRLKNCIVMTSDKKVVSASKPKKGYTTLTAKKAGSCQVMITNSAGTVLTHVFYVDKPQLSEKKLTMAVGQNKSLVANVGMWTSKYKIYWGSSNPDVAYVENGVVYGTGKGSATISAYINGKKYSSKVKVKEVVKPEALTGSIELAPLQEIKVDGGGFKAKGAIWAMETPGIVSVNGAKMVAVGCGTTTVNGHDVNGNVRSFTVTVKPVTPRIMHVNMGSSKTQAFYNVKAKDAMWESSNPEIATVNNGKITGHKNGVALITATYKGFINRVYVFVENPTLTPSDKLFINGKKYSLTVTAGTNAALLSPTTYQTMFFTSKNPEIARVNQYGVVLPISAGKTKMTAKVNGKTINVVVNVFESGTTPGTTSAYAASDAAYEYSEDLTYILSEEGIDEEIAEYEDFTEEVSYEEEDLEDWSEE